MAEHYEPHTRQVSWPAMRVERIEDQHPSRQGRLERPLPNFEKKVKCRFGLLIVASRLAVHLAVRLTVHLAVQLAVHYFAFHARLCAGTRQPSHSGYPKRKIGRGNRLNCAVLTGHVVGWKVEGGILGGRAWVEGLLRWRHRGKARLPLALMKRQ